MGTYDDEGCKHDTIIQCKSIANLIKEWQG